MKDEVSKTSFEKFSEQVYDNIYRQSGHYACDVLGTKKSSNQQLFRDEIFYLVVEKIWKEMNPKKQFNN